MESKGVNYIALAIPFFFLLIGLELWASARKKRRVYRFADAITDLSCGITSQVWAVFSTAALFSVYLVSYEHYRFFSLPADSVWTWVFAFVAVDFLYYWWHRLSHEVNFLWAAHIVHHQSEDYNLAVALRQAITTSFTVIPFYAPLAFLGVPPLVYAAVQSFNTLYQFWIHTELIGKMGWFEKLFNTPSHHRVHHAQNPQYLDKNYAATFIIWDKLFGTFIEEQEAPVYGIVKPLRSYDPMWAQFHYVVELVRDAWRAPQWFDKVRLWWKSPAWHPAGLTGYPAARKVTPETFQKYDPQPSWRLTWHVLVQFIIVTSVATYLIFAAAELSNFWKLALALWVLAALSAWGGLFENKRWALWLEGARIAAGFVLLGLWFVPASV
jgi:sterol desaturase/sphingolipid hydroxylase (fatty acid hydroxylase superfamily)